MEKFVSKSQNIFWILYSALDLLLAKLLTYYWPLSGCADDLTNLAGFSLAVTLPHAGCADYLQNIACCRIRCRLFIGCGPATSWLLAFDMLRWWPPKLACCRAERARANPSLAFLCNGLLLAPRLNSHIYLGCHDCPLLVCPRLTTGRLIKLPAIILPGWFPVNFWCCLHF